MGKNNLSPIENLHFIPNNNLYLLQLQLQHDYNYKPCILPVSSKRISTHTVKIWFFLKFPCTMLLLFHPFQVKIKGLSKHSPDLQLTFPLPKNQLYKVSLNNSKICYISQNLQSIFISCNCEFKFSFCHFILIYIFWICMGQFKWVYILKFNQIGLLSFFLLLKEFNLKQLLSH